MPSSRTRSTQRPDRYGRRVLHDLTALEQGDAVRNGDVSPLELVEHVELVGGAGLEQRLLDLGLADGGRGERVDDPGRGGRLHVGGDHGVLGRLVEHGDLGLLVGDLAGGDFEVGLYTS